MSTQPLDSNGPRLQRSVAPSARSPARRALQARPRGASVWVMGRASAATSVIDGVRRCRSALHTRAAVRTLLVIPRSPVAATARCSTQSDPGRELRVVPSCCSAGRRSSSAARAARAPASIAQLVGHESVAAHEESSRRSKIVAYRLAVLIVARRHRQGSVRAPHPRAVAAAPEPRTIASTAARSRGADRAATVRHERGAFHRAQERATATFIPAQHRTLFPRARRAAARDAADLRRARDRRVRRVGGGTGARKKSTSA